METMQRPSPTSPRLLSKGMLVNQIMTRGPVCCLRSDTVQRVAAIMRDEDTGLVPVVENEHEGVLIGVVTDRDLCLAILAEGHDIQAPVADCMTSSAITCRADDPIVRVLHLMEQNQIRRVPVVDHLQRVQGIVSLADIVRRSNLDGETTQEALREICQPRHQDPWRRGQPAPASSPAVGGASRPRGLAELAGNVLA